MYDMYRFLGKNEVRQNGAPDPDTGTWVTFFNPRLQQWHEHFEWVEEGTVVRGKTPQGRATVIALHMNDSFRVATRRLWVLAGWHPPAD
jgi:hypothetical protein